MPFGGADLNLLLPLKVLLEEGSVTRAGRRLHVSQSAMSATLARLRRQFDDRLLVRVGHGYELTPLARDLLPEVQHALLLVESALRLEEEFDPATSERTFRLAMSDYAMATISESLVAMVQAQAPGVRLVVDSLSGDAHSSDRVLVENDVLVAPHGYGFPGESRPLWRDRMVVLADRGTPRLAKGELTLADLADLPHAVASFGRGVITPVDRAFAEVGVERRIAIHVFGFLPLPFVVVDTAMVAVVPELLARVVTREDGPLVQVEPAFGDVVLAESYWFAPDRLSDTGHRWLFARLDEVGERLAAGR